MARCIVNSPPDNNNNDESKVSSTSASIFSRFKKQNLGSREFKNGVSQVTFWGSSGQRPPAGIFSDPQFNNVISNPAINNNLPQTSNDPVDMTGAFSNSVGAANGYIFPKPAKITQGFKTFGIRLGKFGHLYGTGAFYSHHDYPYQIR